MDEIINKMRGEGKLNTFLVPLEKYNPVWRENYLLEKSVLEKALPAKFIAHVSHIGGTSVPGMISRPIIDILFEVENGVDLEWLEYKMLSLDYLKVSVPDKPFPHVMYIKGYTPEGFQGQLYHVYIRFRGNWDEIHFRNYLRMNPEHAEVYGDLKWGFRNGYGEQRDLCEKTRSQFISLTVQMEKFWKGPKYCIRRAVIRDIPVLKQLFKETVMTVNSRDYTREEVADWASCGDNDERWEKLVYFHYTLVVEDEDARVLGFMALTPKGHLNSLFVHKDFQNQGVATILYQLVETRADSRKIAWVTADVSLTACPFFQKMGFVIDEEQSWQANHLYLRNYRMSKQMDCEKEDLPSAWDLTSSREEE